MSTVSKLAKCIKQTVVIEMYWKMMRVAVNVCSVHYRVRVLEIGACGCKCMQCAL